MKADAAARAAGLLAEAWQMGVKLPALPEDFRPRSLADGYQVQARFAALTGLPIGAWKIGCTSPGARKILKARGPFAGRVVSTRVFDSGARITSQAYPTRGLEAEFAFRLAKPLGPRRRPYTRAEVLAAVESVHPAIEIIDPRYADWLTVGLPSIVADLAANGALVVGPAIKRWRTLDLARQAVRLMVGGSVKAEGTGAEVMGDPAEALRWLVNFLRTHGGLPAGMLVTTGTCTGLQFAPEGTKITAAFGAAAKVEFQFV